MAFANGSCGCATADAPKWSRRAHRPLLPTEGTHPPRATARPGACERWPYESFMSKPWELIAQCLRAELADYGGLLHLFEAQQRSAAGRDSKAELNFAREIEAQARVAAHSRHRREEAVIAFAEEFGRPGKSPLRSMMTLIEPDARPLLEALIAEVNLVSHRVRRASQQNHTLLAHAVDVYQDILQHLRPDRPRARTRSGGGGSPSLRPIPQ